MSAVETRTPQVFSFSEITLESERLFPIKHECIRGLVYAIAGASKAHGIIALNLATRLRNHLRGKGCTTYIADIKVRMEAANVYSYPDVTGII